MKKILLSILLISSMAMAEVGEIGLGYAKGNNSDNFITGFASLKIVGDIGARLEYTKNISENPEFSKEDISRYGLFATYTLPILPNISITPKIGLTKTDHAFKLLETVGEVTKSSTKFTYGLEMNYDLNDQISIFVGYTDYGNTLDIKNIDTSKLDTANYTFGIKIHI